MRSRSIKLSAVLLFAINADSTATFAQPVPPEPPDQRRAVGEWLVEHQAESDGGRIVRLTRAYHDHILEYYVSFWRGNAGPYSHASVEQAGRGCGSENWHRDPAGNLWGPEPDAAAREKIVRARLSQSLGECGAGEQEIASALAGFEAAFELASAWAEEGRRATLAEMQAIENYGREPESVAANIVPLNAAPSIPAAAQEPAVEALGADYLAAEPHSAGLSIGIVRNGETSFHHFGIVKKGGGKPNAATRYEIGSIAKTFTGLILARAVAAGKLGFDDDVRRYLGGEYPKLQFEGAPVRVRHLANMTSALPDNLPDLSAIEPDPGRFQRARALAAYTKADFMRDLQNVAPSARPGENVGHSNLAAQLLIYVLERACGSSYEDLLAREIERPLDFAAAAPRSKLIPGYDAEGRVAAASPTASFGWRYTLRDMLSYAALQLDESDGPVKTSHEGTWFTLDRKKAVAMPWIVSFLPDGRKLHYSGGTYGFSSYMAIYPERKLGIVLLANNKSDTAQDRLSKIADSIAAVE